MPLTDLQARKALPKDKPYRLADGAGMYLEVHPNGSKYWRLKYRFANKEKRLALGVYPDTSLGEAREQRDEARKLLAAGVDPGLARRAQKAARATAHANSFEAVAREWYAKRLPTWSEKYASGALAKLEQGLFPWLGSRPIAEVKAPELLQCLRRIEGRGTIDTAHRTKGIAGEVFRYAVATGRAERDPSADLKGALAPVKVQHLKALTEPAQVAPLLRAIDGYSGGPVVCAALRLAPMLFVRPGELRRAEWVDIDLAAEEWRYTVTKTDTQHIVPLPSQAVAILRELQAITGEGRYVFPSGRGASRPMSENGVTAALHAMGFGDVMTGHGFRAMARTILDEVVGVRPDYIEHQLAHAVRDPNGRAYNRTAFLAERKKMMQTWADYLDRLKSGAEVIPLRGGVAA
ncbi:tyrosine-type recombinase/integrase [Uliginosibacterium sp. H1]|uniref:tyrosine-type recombinase/integrase n=1 Tax=Uliginosibacterium sp. H1 TaxID=3114757 RepID=UPI002E18CCA8|nr:integrase arm-type DNA-binding domain-containing protein [Uliginosibacterium sp. H1]